MVTAQRRARLIVGRGNRSARANHAGHVKSGLPLTVARAQRAHPSVHFVLTRPLDVHARIVSVLSDRLSGMRSGDAEHVAGTRVVVGRGSDGADADGEVWYREVQAKDAQQLEDEHLIERPDGSRSGRQHHDLGNSP